MRFFSGKTIFKRAYFAVALIFSALLAGATSSLSGCFDNATELQTSHRSKRPQTFHEIGVVLLERGFTTEAIPILERAQLIAPRSAVTKIYLASAYDDKGLVDKEIHTLKSVIKLDSTRNSQTTADAWIRLGKIYGQNDRLVESRFAYEQALSIEIRDVELLYVRNQLAELDLTEGKYENDGNSLFNAGGEVIGGVGPGDMRTNKYFEIARHTSDWKKKAIFFKKATEADTEMYQAYFNTGLALTHQLQFTAAIPYFEKSNHVWLRRSDVNPSGGEKSSALAYLGHCYGKTGDLQAGLQFCNRAIALDATYYDALLFKAEILVQLKHFSEATGILHKLLQDNPDEKEILDLLYEIGLN